VAAVRGQHPHGPGAGIGKADHGAEEAAEQFLDIVLVGETRRHLGDDVEGLEMVVAARVELGALGRDRPCRRRVHAPIRFKALFIPLW
jgi:hypothetical protein